MACSSTETAEVAVPCPTLSTSAKPTTMDTLLCPHTLQVRGCLTESEARRFVETAESLGFQHQGSRGPAYGEAFRDNDRISVNDQALADQLWVSTGLAQALRECNLDGAQPVGLNSNLRFYRCVQAAARAAGSRGTGTLSVCGQK